VSEVKSEVKAEPVGAPLKEGIQWEEAAPTTDPNHEEALQWEDAAPATEPKADNDAGKPPSIRCAGLMFIGE
jgi:hypothetical protein